MTFEQQFDAARYNYWYWISYAAMVLAPVVGAICIALRLRGRGSRLCMYCLLGIACFLVTTCTTVLAIQEKWDRRYTLKGTDPQMQRVSADGANLTFSPIIGGFCGGISVLPLVVTATGMQKLFPATAKSAIDILPANPD